MGGGRMEEGTLVTQTQLWRGEMIPPEKPGGSSGKPCQWRSLGHRVHLKMTALNELSHRAWLCPLCQLLQSRTL